MHFPIRVLFLSEGNSVRSQMAEALLRKLGGERVDVHSAGLEPLPLHSLAVASMAEIGIAISGWKSKHLNEYLDSQFDYVITLCDRSREYCPDFARDGETLHWSFSDPAGFEGSEAERLAAFRRERDAIRQRVADWLASIPVSPDRPVA